MVKVTIMGSTGVIGKNVAFTLARADTVDEIVMFARSQSIDKAKGETFDMYDENVSLGEKINIFSDVTL